MKLEIQQVVLRHVIPNLKEHEQILDQIKLIEF